MLSFGSLKQAIHKLYNPSKYIRPKSKTIYKFFMDKLRASKNENLLDVLEIGKFKDESDAYVVHDTFQTIFKTIDSVVKLSVVDLLDLPYTEYNLSVEYECKIDDKTLLEEKIENILKELQIVKDAATSSEEAAVDGMPNQTPLPDLDDSERLSKDFCISMFYANSNTAKSMGIDNTPDKYAYDNIKKVAALCQKIKDSWGAPIRINSCYRCPKLNAAVKGSKTSDHMYGAAADITTKSDLESDNAKLYFHILKMIKEKKLTGVRQVIWEFGTGNGPSWVHIAVNHPKAATRNNHLVFIPKDKEPLANKLAPKHGITSGLRSYVA